jgi:segregation and condensation protein B
LPEQRLFAKMAAETILFLAAKGVVGMTDAPDPEMVNPVEPRPSSEAWTLELSEPAAPQQVESGTAPPPVLRIVEAMLFVGGSPLTLERSQAAIRGLTEAQFAECLQTLNRDYRRQGRPYAIQAQPPGYVLALRTRYRPVVERLFGQVKEARLSMPALDVLSLVAYRQPVAKQEVDSLRGAESGALLRQLVRRGLIAVIQRGEAGQREISYGTTQRFLELFKLSSLEDLPQTQDLQKL